MGYHVHPAQADCQCDWCARSARIEVSPHSHIPDGWEMRRTGRYRTELLCAECDALVLDVVDKLRTSVVTRPAETDAQRVGDTIRAVRKPPPGHSGG